MLQNEYFLQGIKNHSIETRSTNIKAWTKDKKGTGTQSPARITSSSKVWTWILFKSILQMSSFSITTLHYTTYTPPETFTQTCTRSSLPAFCKELSIERWRKWPEEDFPCLLLFSIPHFIDIITIIYKRIRDTNVTTDIKVSVWLSYH